jgi:hypothetical protein
MSKGNQTNELVHKLWLIYSQLKDAECDPVQRLQLLENSRTELGKVLNDMEFGYVTATKKEGINLIGPGEE